MTILFIDPSELHSNSKWPASIRATECPGLEALTGADFVISKLPINPVSNLDWHKANRSLFVQRKSGYDVFNFEQMNLEIARMKAIGLTMQQCFILFIGRCYPDGSGLAVIDGKKPYGETTYRTFEKRQGLIEARGVKFRQIASSGELETWIEVQAEVVAEVEDQPVKTVALKPFVDWANEDIWQEVRTPDENSPEYSLVCGIKGLGPKTIEAAIQCCKENYLPVSGINLLKVLTFRDEKGKLLYKVNGWGDKSADRVRQMLGLGTFEAVYLPGGGLKNKKHYQNIYQSVLGDDTDPGMAWWNGVNDGLNTVEMLSKEHKINNANQLLFLARRAAISFGLVDKGQVDRWLGELYCDDWLKTKHPEIYNEFLEERTSK